ncbi:hypothetical protein GPECTOR_52g14 [Gonium pectorale]|uniref:Uncharacterized protein n=1 Tax=Gonium pectorale TaxID=33097 RepID=A0A150G712_GONPE|nr:hypothetical protein GPECTOR_52g14 [Gonium pectorale]|eukprot:KXZ45611.1 hypothetical protein GPECTOR_52g14 [Gonium pectorale]
MACLRRCSSSSSGLRGAAALALALALVFAQQAQVAEAQGVTLPNTLGLAIPGLGALTLDGVNNIPGLANIVAGNADPASIASLATSFAGLGVNAATQLAGGLGGLGNVQSLLGLSSGLTNPLGSGQLSPAQAAQLAQLLTSTLGGQAAGGLAGQVGAGLSGGLGGGVRRNDIPLEYGKPFVGSEETDKEVQLRQLQDALKGDPAIAAVVAPSLLLASSILFTVSPSLSTASGAIGAAGALIGNIVSWTKWLNQAEVFFVDLRTAGGRRLLAANSTDPGTLLFRQQMYTNLQTANRAMQTWGAQLQKMQKNVGSGAFRSYLQQQAEALQQARRAVSVVASSPLGSALDLRSALPENFGANLGNLANLGSNIGKGVGGGIGGAGGATLGNGEIAKRFSAAITDALKG